MRVFLLSIIFALTAQAQGRWDGIFAAEQKRRAEKLATIQYTRDLGYWLQPYAAGSIIARRNMREFSKYLGIVEAGLSLRVVTDFGLYGQFQQGVAYASHTDRFFQTRLQFPTSASFGLINKKGQHLGVIYKHYSNGNGNPRNRGRDFLGLEFGF